MSPAKAIVTGWGGSVGAGARVDDVVVESSGSLPGEVVERPEEQATSSAAAMPPMIRHRTGQRYRFVPSGPPDYNLPKLLSGQCCLESAWTEPIRRPTG
jgi:hypothetical protein